LRPFTDMASTQIEFAVGAAALTELEHRMYEHSVGLRTSPSIPELLQELSCSAASTQSETDVATGQTCSWISEMRSVEEAVEDALREEGFDGFESEHPSVEDAMDSRIAQLQCAVSLQIVAPLFKAFGDAQEQAASRMMLPAFSYDVLTLLAKTWHLAQVRGLQVQRLKSSIASLQTEIKAKKMESLSQVKPMLKEKSWELAQAQARIEQLEGKFQKTGRQFLQLERAKQRETSCREECERRLSSLQSDNHRLLSSSKAVMQQVKEGLTDARDEIQRQQKQQRQRQHSCRGVQSVHASSEACPSSLQTCLRRPTGRLQAVPRLPKATKRSAACRRFTAPALVAASINP